jgi:hypothetical protein
MNQPSKNRAMETVEKQTAVFPPFPQPLLLLTNQMQSSQSKTKELIVYTKSLTLPRLHKMLDAACRRLHP